MRGPLVLLAALCATAAGAQLPEETTNLKVFPEGTSVRELMGSMRSFTEALGVRCNHCHVGESPDSLEGYDFASDEKETKRVARVMLRMVAAINSSHLPETGREEVVEVTCATCHRGVSRPQQLADLLLSTADAEGLDAALARYRELRAEHYGSGAYDFSPRPLDKLTETMAMARQDSEGAMAVNTLNLEFHPDAAYALYLRARLLLRGGDREGAISALEHAVAKNPDEGWLVGQLEELRTPPESDDG